jgi:hypothetical protein
MVVSAVRQVGAAIRSAPRSVADLNAANLTRPFKPATAWYDRLESYYRNDPYTGLNAAAYRGAHGLPRSLRSLYNPFPRAVNWYPGHVYPPDQDVIPFAAGTDPELEGCVVTAFEVWGNWQRERTIYVRNGARLGNSFIELEADFESGRIYPRVIHPAYVSDIELNHRGDVIMYHLSIPRVDEAGKAYTYGKRVTRDSIETFRDDKPAAYNDDPSVIDNPFPFAPGVWVPHFSTGEILGASCADGVLGKIDALNAMATSVHDYIGKFNRQGVVFSSSKPATTLAAAIAAQSTKRGATDDLADPYADSQDIRYFHMPQDGSVHRLIENLGIGEAFQYLSDMRDELEADLPEVKFDKELRQMSDVTGPGAMRMSGDVVNRLGEAQGNYDWGIKRAGAMAVTMGALMFRALERRGLTDQQRAFLTFDESSFDAGELDFDLRYRPLLSETPMERVTYAAAIERLTTPTGLEYAGLSDEQIYGEADDGVTVTRQRAGLLAEQESAVRTAADASATRFNAGLPFG